MIKAVGVGRGHGRRTWRRWWSRFKFFTRPTWMKSAITISLQRRPHLMVVDFEYDEERIFRLVISQDRRRLSVHRGNGRIELNFLPQIKSLCVGLWSPAFPVIVRGSGRMPLIIFCNVSLGTEGRLRLVRLRFCSVPTPKKEKIGIFNGCK